MKVLIKYTKICEKHNEPHPPPLEETWEDVTDFIADKEDSVIALRLGSGDILQLNRSCILRMEVDI